MDPSDQLVVLGFGCGSGLLMEQIRTQFKEVICVDASWLMVDQVVDKSKAGGWSNVRAYTAILSELDGQSEEVQKRMEELAGKVDLIVASSILNFIPNQGTEPTAEAKGWYPVSFRLAQIRNDGERIHTRFDNATGVC